MIADLKCEICLDNFDTQRMCPRVCASCGHTVCEKCLIDIKYRTQILKCPFCKTTTKDIWPKNLTVVGLVEFDDKTCLCQKHKRPAISFCASKGCIAPVAICDLGECAKLHQEKGTNSIPISLLGINSTTVKQKQISLNVIDDFYNGVEKEVTAVIRDRKLNSKVFNLQSKIASSKFKPQTNRIIHQIVESNIKQITSDDLVEVKKEILELEEDQNLDYASKNQELVNIQKHMLIEKLTQVIQNLKIDLFPKQFEQPRAKIIKGGELQPEFQIISRVIGSKFNPYLLFDSNIHTPLVFRSRVVGQPNIVFYVELEDGTAFGSCFKRTFTKYFFQDRKMIDFDSFVFWVNEEQVFKASSNSISNFDMGPEHYFSVGNTNNWDGFWFKNHFKEINPDSPKMVIKSSQFEKLEIPLKTKAVKVFRTYQLDMQ